MKQICHKQYKLSMANIIINTMILLSLPFGIYGFYILLGDKLDNLMKASRIHRVVNNFIK